MITFEQFRTETIAANMVYVTFFGCAALGMAAIGVVMLIAFARSRREDAKIMCSAVSTVAFVVAFLCALPASACMMIASEDRVASARLRSIAAMKHIQFTDDPHVTKEDAP